MYCGDPDICALARSYTGFDATHNVVDCLPRAKKHVRTITPKPGVCQSRIVRLRAFRLHVGGEEREGLGRVFSGLSLGERSNGKCQSVAQGSEGSDAG